MIIIRNYFAIALLLMGACSTTPVVKEPHTHELVCVGCVGYEDDLNRIDSRVVDLRNLIEKVAKNTETLTESIMNTADNVLINRKQVSSSGKGLSRFEVSSAQSFLAIEQTLERLGVEHSEVLSQFPIPHPEIGIDFDAKLSLVEDRLEIIEETLSKINDSVNRSGLKSFLLGIFNFLLGISVTHIYHCINWRSDEKRNKKLHDKVDRIPNTEKGRAYAILLTDFIGGLAKTLGKEKKGENNDRNT